MWRPLQTVYGLAQKHRGPANTNIGSHDLYNSNTHCFRWQKEKKNLQFPAETALTLDMQCYQQFMTIFFSLQRNTVAQSFILNTYETSLF